MESGLQHAIVCDLCTGESNNLKDGIVDPDKIEAAFKNGVLNVTLPKKPEAQKPAKNIEVKAA